MFLRFATCPSHFLGWNSSFFHVINLVINRSIGFIRFLPLLYHPITCR
uniref:Uncharacterized protein n=1 Tax=Siphoviridae sp. ctZE52 TaxID=2825557 RepID=A0A8S5P3Y7_9CAUD|nr:MAG TPA: hypothetical protein [Siphoviridae sp. ctZE52]